MKMFNKYENVIEIIINHIGIKKFYIYVNKRRSMVTKYLINKDNFWEFV